MPPLPTPHPDPRARVLRSIAWAILAAAVVSTPGFLVAEGFEPERVARIAASNGSCAAGAVALLWAIRRGHVAGPARVLVFALLALVAWLAWTSGEDVHVNVVNFVLVTVLAGTLLSRAEALACVGAASAGLLCAIAWRQSAAQTALTPFVESVAQFLPTYAVLVFVLWVVRPAQEPPPC